MSGELGDREGRLLLEMARNCLEQRLTGSIPTPFPRESWMEEMAAAFVTLKIDNSLRGCIGNLEPVASLWQGVHDNTVNAAFHDSRFSPLTLEELASVRLEISILSQPEKLHYQGAKELLEKLQPGVDGVILREGKAGATFLPQVWQQLPEPELFLGQLCLKAGLARGGWREGRAEIQTYQVQSFQETRI